MQPAASRAAGPRAAGSQQPRAEHAASSQQNSRADSTAANSQQPTAEQSRAGSHQPGTLAHCQRQPATTSRAGGRAASSHQQSRQPATSAPYSQDFVLEDNCTVQFYDAEGRQALERDVENQDRGSEVTIKDLF